MALRHKVAHLLDRSGAVDAVLRARRRSPSKWLAVLTYHRVWHAPPDYRFDRGVVDATPGSFTEQLEVLRDHFNSVTVQDLLALEEGKPLPPNPVMITFDDGYIDNHEMALPLLKKYGHRATFFISTGHVSERRMFWWDRVNYCVQSARRGVVELSYPTRLRFEFPRDAGLAIATCNFIIKETQGLDLERFLQELAAAVDVSWTRQLDREYADAALMTWDQIRTLKAEGMDVQSHSRSHLPLHTLSRKALVDELVGSRRTLEDQLGGEVRAIAYPVGRDSSRMAQVDQAVEQAGYRFGFTNGTGLAPMGAKMHKRWLPRISMDESPPLWQFRGMLTLPGLV